MTYIRLARNAQAFILFSIALLKISSFNSTDDTDQKATKNALAQIYSLMSSIIENSSHFEDLVRESLLTDNATILELTGLTYDLSSDVESNLKKIEAVLSQAKSTTTT